MKALSYKQPWAYLVAAGIKEIENRVWPCPTKYIGKRILIHTSGQCVGIKELDSLLNDDTRKLFEENGFTREVIKQLRRSSIIGSVVIKECIQDSKSIWAIPGYYHWVLEHPIMFEESISCKGSLGFWNYPNILAEPEEKDGKLFCHCTLPVKEKNQVSSNGDGTYSCRYCGGEWYK